MDLFEFRDTLKTLVSLNNIDVNLQVDGIQSPKNFFLVQSINTQIGLGNYIEYEIAESGLEFSFYNKNDYKFLIKKEDENLKNPPLYYAKKPYLKQSSAFLLIELAKWFSEKSQFSYTSKNIYRLKSIVSNMFHTLIRDEDLFFKKLWINEELGTYIIEEDDIKMTIVSKDQNSLDNVLSKLGLGNIGDGKELPYNSYIILDGKINNDTVSGKIKFLNDELINVKVVIEKEITEDHFEKVVYRWDDVLREKLSVTKYKEIQRQLTEKVTKATYSQNKKADKNFLQEKTDKLFYSLSLSEIIFFDKSMSFIFNSTEFPDYTINGILNRNLKLVETIFE